MQVSQLRKMKLSDLKQSNWATVENIVAHFIPKKEQQILANNDDDMIYRRRSF